MMAAVATPRWRLIVFWLGALIVFGGYAMSIQRNEQLLADGAVVRLALAPVDPRAFLTGDYMALDYEIARAASRQPWQRADAAAQPGSSAGSRQPADRDPDRNRDRNRDRDRYRDGYAIVTVDADRVARLSRVQHGAAPVAAGELALLLRQRGGRVSIGSNAWYFQEGTAAAVEGARFGEFRIAADGRMLLVRLLDKAFKPL